MLINFCPIPQDERILRTQHTQHLSTLHVISKWHLLYFINLIVLINKNNNSIFQTTNHVCTFSTNYILPWLNH